MEIKANHVLIGAFTLISTVAMLIFLVWLGQFTFDQKFEQYKVAFPGGVSGLEVGAEVRYSGIKVGEVTSVSLDKDNPNLVNVGFRVNDGTPIYRETTATIEQGLLTGVGTLLLTLDTKDRSIDQMERLQAGAQVATGQTDFQQVAQNLPQFLSDASKLVTRLNAVLKTDNRDAFAKILTDTSGVTGAIASQKDAIAGIVADIGETAANAKSASLRFEAIASGLSEAADAAADEAGPALRNISEAAANTAKLAETLQGTANELRVPLRDFARGGLPQFVLFIQEARALSQSLDRLVEKVESNPGGFILGTDTPTYTPK
jgi:phospholipid/cholesterol/gamma-HCH transport system substrate-binding protein